MAIFHMTIKIVGRSKGKSIIAASAYLNGDVMKDYETGRTSYYTSKNEVVCTRLMMCENAPPEWSDVSEENIARFQKSLRYRRSADKEAELEKFEVTFQKQKLWNEVLKVEKGSDAQLGRSFEFSLPNEWNRKEQIDITTDFIQRNFVNKGMCADWSIHDRRVTSEKSAVGNPHVHLLLTMRPFNKDHSWGNKEVKDWNFERDSSGQILINPSHPNWWQDKKDPSRCGIRIPILDEEGNQKVGARNRKQWKRVLTDSTGWNNPKNCELWRSEWAKECNLYLSKEKWIDHRSFARQGKVEIPTIHEGTSARMIDQRFRDGKSTDTSWKVEKNQTIRKQNSLLQKLQDAFVNVAAWLKQWKENLDDIRREQSSYSHDGRNDSSDRGTAGFVAYALLITVFMAIRTQSFVNDVVIFFQAIWEGILDVLNGILYIGKQVATLSERISNTTASAVLNWVLLIGMIVILVSGIIAVVWFAVKWISSIYKKYCWDEISVMVAIISVALVIFFGDRMKQFLSINQVVLLILLQGIYTIIRWYVQGCMENRGY